MAETYILNSRCYHDVYSLLYERTQGYFVSFHRTRTSTCKFSMTQWLLIEMHFIIRSVDKSFIIYSYLSYLRCAYGLDLYGILVRSLYDLAL